MSLFYDGLRMCKYNCDNVQMLRALALQQGKAFTKMSRMISYIKQVVATPRDPATAVAAIGRKLAEVEEEMFSDGRGTWDELTGGPDE